MSQTPQPASYRPATEIDALMPDIADPVAADPTEPVVTFADAGEERHYTVQLVGLDGIADPVFDERFAELSVLRQGQDKAANLAQINRRVSEDSELLDRLLRAKGYYSARVRGSVTAPAPGSDRLIVSFAITPGTRYLLSSVDVTGLAETGDKEAELRAAFPPKVDDPVDADAIIAGRVFSLPHASKVGVISVVVVFACAIAYLVLPGMLNGILGKGCI